MIIENVEKRYLDNIIKQISNELGHRFSNIEFSIKNDKDLNESKELITCVAQGLSGLFLLYGELDFTYPDNGWDKKGHNILIEVFKEFEDTGINSLSAFNGLAGLGFAVSALSKHGTRYKTLLRTLHEMFLKNLNSYLIDFKANQTYDRGIDPYLFDTCYGLTGIGRFLLTIEDNTDIKDPLEEILKIMVKITGDININGTIVPGWFSPSCYNTSYDTGFFDTGLAHGICGPMNLMSLALNKGYCVRGQKEAITKISEWLLSKLFKDGYGVWIPNIISFQDEVSSTINNKNKRDAWCYGLPGVSRSLFITGKSLGNVNLIKLSENMIYQVIKRDFEKQHNISPTICHGVSGLLHIVNIMNKEINDETLKDYQITLVKKILSFYDEEQPFGFKDINIRGERRLVEDKVGFLEGSTGVLLALLAYKNQGTNTGWDKLLLLD